MGAYPFVKAGATSDDCELYEEFDSTDGKIFFAGDGVSCQLIGTVHGAYITGVKAAENALAAEPAEEEEPEEDSEEEDEQEDEQEDEEEDEEDRAQIKAQNLLTSRLRK